MRKFILGTDWSSDCDDVLALRLFCRAHKKGEIKLLGVNVDDNVENAVRSLGAFLTSEGCPDIPVGFDRTAKRVCFNPRYQKRMSLLPSPYTSNEDAEPSLTFYRRLLATSDEAVEIVEIGYTQSLAALLKSKPDDVSPLSGRELVETKIKKLWIMAGKWDEQGGKEHNFDGTRATKKGGAYICKNWPTPITFLGWEVSHDVCIGADLPEGDVARNALIDYGCDPAVGRAGWDPMLARLALVGDEEKAGYRCVKGKAKLSALTGKNRFVPGEGNCAYVVKTQPDDHYKAVINELLK